MACKHYLIPEDILQSLISRTRMEKLDHPEDTVVEKIDRDMSSLLHDKSQPESNKAVLFAQKLAHFLNMRDKVDEAPPNDVISINSNKPDIPLHSIPKRDVKKATSLVELLGKDNRISWDDKYRVSIDNQPVDNSNAIDLIKHAVGYKSKRSTPPPAGFHQFKDVLTDGNYPRSIITNKAYEQQQQEEPSLYVVSIIMCAIQKPRIFVCFHPNV